MCDQNAPCSSLFKGREFSCYAPENEVNPTANQFCGFEQDGTVFGAPGCCKEKCPNKFCPLVPPSKKYKIAKVEDKQPPPPVRPIPKLLFGLLILLVSLLIAGLVFDMMENTYLTQKIQKIEMRLKETMPS